MLVKWPEIREVKNPASPAVAFTENGRTVVEVDEKLKGKARAAAIWAAVRLHEQGLAALVGLPLLAIAWNPFKRWAQKHPGAAMATTAVAGSAATAAAALVLPMLLDGAQEPKIAEPPGVLTPAPDRPTQTPTITRKPTRTPTASSTTAQDVPEPAARPEPRPVTLPVRTPTRPAPPGSTAAGGVPETEEPDATRQSRSDEPRPEGVVADPTPPPPQAPTLPTVEAASAPPGPEPASEAGGCLLRVDVDPLLDVCALG
jgi:hypothetical protein